MKKKSLFCLLGLILIVILYFVIKGIFLWNYHYHELSNVLNHIHITKELTIQKKEVDKQNSFQMTNISIENPFPIDTKVVKTDENWYTTTINGTYTAIRSGKDKNYVDYFKEDNLEIFGNDARGTEKYLKADRKEFLKENKIKDDLDLLFYIEKHKKLNSHIFTSIKQMKKNYAYNTFVDTVFPVTESITPITGDFKGYIFNLKEAKEVHIIRGQENYCLTFVNLNYFTGEKIREILSSIEFND